MRNFIYVVLLLATGTSLVYGSDPAPYVQDPIHPKLHLVQKICVGSMGEADEADRFRLLLEEHLAKKGFTIVEREADADAILTGALAVRVQHSNSRARVYVKLNTPQGEKLWGRDFGSRITSPFNRTEPVKLRAKDVADGLREDWEKAARVTSSYSAI